MLYEKGVVLDLQRPKQQFRVSLALVHANLPTALQSSHLLHPKELKKLNDFKYDLRKHSYLIGRIAAKKALTRLTNIQEASSFWIDKGVFEFPVVKGVNKETLQVSISHCGSIGVAVAFPATHPMAIDLEQIDEAKAIDISSQLTSNEHSLDAEPIHLFSVKEALSKVLRTGMMIDFKFLAIQKIHQKKATILVCTFKHFPQYKAIALTDSSHVLSIVLPARSEFNLSVLDSWWTSLEWKKE